MARPDPWAQRSSRWNSAGVILLVSVEDLSYADAAHVLGIPIGTVMSRLARGRERLRQLTEEDEVRPVLRRVK